MPATCIPSRRSAFTLIELLVVISIVALLVALLLPVLSSARGTAASIKCLSNQRSVILANLAYAADHQQQIAPWEGSYGGSTLPWHRLLAASGYLNVDSNNAALKSAYGCPSAFVESATGSKGFGLGYPLSVNYPAYWAGWPWMLMSQQIDRESSPSTFAVVADTRLNAAGTFVEQWLQVWPPGVAMPVFDSSRIGDPHGGSANVAMLDGSASTYGKPQDIWSAGSVRFMGRRP